ncbi:DsbA family protein [Micavibrio aeruginosavorus]|uniref:DsbA family protein n=1 Tax=Micavibrio aeruginosavorus TaxID=349221 RepID=UPI003F4AAF5C
MTVNNKTLFVVLILAAVVLAGGSFALFKNKMSNVDTSITAESDVITDLTEVAPAAAGTEDVAAAKVESKTYDVSSDPFAPRTLGNPDAPVKLEEFASLTCSHCAHFHNDTFAALKEKFIDTGVVYFTFTDFPLNAPALQASMIARCMPGERYFTFLGLLFKTQEQWAFSQDPTKVLRQSAKLAGMSDETFDACLANDKLKQHIADTMQKKADKYQVSSTPSFIFNDGADSMTGAQAIDSFASKIEELNK